MKTLLIVDDDKDVRTMIRTFFADSYSILEASDGKAALQVVSEKPVDLVIADIFMPEMDGLELILCLKAWAPEIKIIGVSGGGRFDGDGTMLGVAKHLGADAVAAKPFDLGSLQAAFERLV